MITLRRRETFVVDENFLENRNLVRSARNSEEKSNCLWFIRTLRRKETVVIGKKL